MEAIKEMKIHNWYSLAVISNLSFMIMMVVFLFETKTEFSEMDYSEYLFILFMREIIILMVQISYNLLLYVIPKLFPVPIVEPK